MTWLFVDLCTAIGEARPGATAGAGSPRCRSRIARAARERADPGRPHALPRRDRRAGPRDQRRASRHQASWRAAPQHCYEALKALRRPGAAGAARALTAEADLDAGDARTPRAARCALRYNHALDDARSARRVRAAGVAGRAQIDGHRPPRPTATRCATQVTGRELPRVAERIGDPEDRAAAVRRTGATSCASCSRRTCRAPTPTPAGCSRTGARSEDPTRMFAGEGAPERTNRRFHYLVARAAGARACRPRSTRSRSTARTRTRARTSTARSATRASRSRPLDDTKKLYSGFDLCAPTTSVSMTINGPAPIILAMFMNAAIDQQVERHLRATGRWEAARAGPLDERLSRARRAAPDATRARCPTGNDGLGPGAARRLRRLSSWTRETYERIKARRRCGRCAARCRPTSSRRTRRRTPASSRPSSRCG